MSSIPVAEKLTSFRREINHFQGFLAIKESYSSSKQFPSYFDFDKGTLPYKDEYNNLVYTRALSLKRNYGEKIWDKATRRLTEKQRQDFQIVIIPSRHDHDGDEDFSKKFQTSLAEFPLGKHPVAIYKRGMQYSNDPFEGEKIIEDMVNVKSVYIVASPLDEQDLEDIRLIANQYLNHGALEVNLISPYLPYEREDKNINKKLNSNAPTYIMAE